MRFGEVLKKIRTQQRDSLRALSGKTGIYFTYIDKIEKSEKPINIEILEKLVKEYPLQKKELIKAYVNETIPDFVIEEIKSPYINNENIMIELYNIFLEKLDIKEQKDILRMVIERLEILSFRKGTLEEDKNILDEIKEKIDKI
ncbi:helix-turn-helix transcriptional regulator [Fusobacterium ulcerans]|uniref:helix-turn-helix domain-containing protein n=1 Tax=Fusobacterium ulcerans TaxID=861 RepID=UPI001030254F|nr:helix-turn-helix transcriptional regulator [Fusobacterium ulcerans]